MQKDWTRFLQISVISAAAVCGALHSFAFGEAEEPAQEDTQQQVYLSQMAKYPVLNKEFKQEIKTNAHPRPAPSEDENVFLWQLEDYQKLNKESADTFAQNADPRPAPATAEEIYFWQLEDYKNLDKTFYNEHRRKP